MFNPVDQPTSLLKLLNICFNYFQYNHKYYCSAYIMLLILTLSELECMCIALSGHFCACLCMHGGQVIEIHTQAFLLQKRKWLHHVQLSGVQLDNLGYLALMMFPHCCSLKGKPHFNVRLMHLHYTDQLQSMAVVVKASAI